MRSLRDNSILKNTILGFFLLFMVFAPISHGLTQNIAHAETAAEKETRRLATNEEAKKAILGGSSIITNILGGAWNGLINILGNVLLSIASMFTWFFGELLEISLQWTVFEMGDRLNKDLGIAINNAWGLIRDICNLIFIFGFIYTGIRTIIDPESAETKRFLSQIIIGALLINFSLFIVKFIVDFSNFLSVQIFTTLTDGVGSISEKITQILGVVTIYKTSGIIDAAKNILTDTGIWFYVLGALFLLITAFVFAAASILLIVRFVGLVFIMIVSPVLFAAMVFPQTEHYASELWKKLFQYAFFAPAYLLLTLITIKLLEALGVSSTSGGFVNALTNIKESNFSIIIIFSIAIGMLIASLTIAQKMGVAGGELAISGGKKIRDFAWKYTGVAAKNYALRYASQKVRQFEGAEHHSSQTTLAGKLGASGFGHFIKKMPTLVPLQAAGHRVVHDFKEVENSLAGMRTSELKERFRMKFATDAQKVGAAKQIYANKDIDELEVEEIRELYEILDRNGLGKTWLRKARPDAFDTERTYINENEDEDKGGKSEEEVLTDSYSLESIAPKSKYAFSESDMVKAHLKSKNRSDTVTDSWHKITFSETGEGTGTDPEERKKTQQEHLRNIIQLGTGAEFEGIASRNDIGTVKVKDAMRAAIKQWRPSVSDDQLNTDATIYIDYWKKEAAFAQKKMDNAKKAYSEATDERVKKRIKGYLEKWSEVKDRTDTKVAFFANPQQARKWGIDMTTKKPSQNNGSSGSAGTSDASLKPGETTTPAGIILSPTYNGPRPENPSTDVDPDILADEANTED